MKEKQTRALVLWRAFRAPSSLAPLPFRVEGVVSPGEGPVSCSYFLVSRPVAVGCLESDTAPASCRSFER